MHTNLNFSKVNVIIVQRGSAVAIKSCHFIAIFSRKKLFPKISRSIVAFDQSVCVCVDTSFCLLIKNLNQQTPHLKLFPHQPTKHKTNYAKVQQSAEKTSLLAAEGLERHGNEEKAR